MRNRCAAAAILAVLLLLTGCRAESARAPEPENPFDIYYCRVEASYGADTGALEAETVDLPEKERTPERVLNAFLFGPRSEALTFPSGGAPQVQSLRVDRGSVILSMDDTFFERPGLERMLCTACLTLTLTQLPEADSVTLVLPGPPITVLGPYTAADFVLYDSAAQNPEYSVLLWYANYEGKLVSARQVISCPDLTLLPELVLEALILQQPPGGALRAIPERTQVLDLSVEDGVASVVLSAEFTRCDTNARTAQNAVRSLTATLCALDGISSVKLAVVGSSTLTNYDISEPITPSPDW